MSDNNENFDALRQLMALKRHEVPPPGYFEDFSSQVMARLKAGEARETTHWTENVGHEAPWLLKFLHFFEAKPAMVGAMAASLCVLLVIGMLYSGDSPADPGIANNNSGSGSLAVSTPVHESPTSPTFFVSDSTSGGGSSGLTVATNFSLQPVSTVFGSQPNPFAQPVSFTTGGN